jgi:hypothetical protein
VVHYYQFLISMNDDAVVAGASRRQITEEYRMKQNSTGRISRRGFGRLTLAAPIAVTAAAAAPRQERRPETAATQPQPSAPDAIAAFDVPMSTEPGFVYRP